MLESYAKHAAVWDWDGYDNTSEYEYWCQYAKRYGKKVLIPMCALGQAGAYIAQKGFYVTAFDITKEMIDEGNKRFGSVDNLSLQVADICNLHLDEKSFDFCLIATQDLHLLSNIEMVRKAFESIAAHLRKGGCFSLELILPSSESYEYPTQTFYPRVPNYTDKKVWKEGKGRYDALTKKHYIDQVVYIKDEKGIQSFPYSVVLQYFEQADIRFALKDAGFMIAAEYCNRNRDTWTSESQEWIVEAIKN
ncbi:MAG TPA: class I SAM-dependent methyltransferase [Firmicutes bacterium]|nr:class I SAM-dependent methyltransferase [Bacillota bacterium]